MAKIGRPLIEIDEKNFKKLCSIQCTLEEIASFFDCSADTIERWCKRELEMSFAEAFKRFSAGGRISLRRNQFKMAESNPTMAIWLGKQYLGQTDKKVVEVEETNNGLQEMYEYFSSKKTSF